MRMLQFADVHLGMENFGSLDVKTGLHSRVLEYLDALDCLVDAAQLYKPDLIIFCGDAFRTRIPNPTLVSHFSARMQRLANIAPMVMIVGNHDRQRGGSEKRHSISLMESLQADNPIIVSENIELLELDMAQVVTLPWAYGDSIENQWDRIYQLIDNVRDDVPLILAGHCTVSGATTGSYEFNSVGSSDAEIHLLEPFLDNWDYVALGHIHKHQCLNDNPPVVYSGSIERVDWGERSDPKGFVLAEVGVGKSTWEFIDLDARPMVELEVDWDNVKFLRKAQVDRAIVRVIVHSKGDPITAHQAFVEVSRCLPASFSILDAVSVSTSSHNRQSRWSGKRLESMSVMDLIGRYFRDRHPEEPGRVKKLLSAARRIVEAVDETVVGV